MTTLHVFFHKNDSHGIAGAPFEQAIMHGQLIKARIILPALSP
jgi:hypothetical protein